MTDDPELTHLLDAWAPPPLSAGFAERLVARAEAGQALPPVTPRRHRLRGAWSRMPRFAIGGVAFGLMTATAAAAAGVFGNVGITIPAWQRTVEKVTGIELAEPVVAAAPVEAAAASPAVTPPVGPASTLREIVADGQIDSREELDAVAAALDARREANRTQRRARTEQRVDAVIAERRARGLPTPSDEEVAAIRERRQSRAAEREEAADARRDARREELGERIDNGEAIDIDTLRPRRNGVGQREAVPGETRAERRRRILGNLTPEQRERLREMRARRRGEAVPEQDSSAPSPEN